MGGRRSISGTPWVMRWRPRPAIEACDTAIRNYPGSNMLSDAYYHKGVALGDLKDANGARAAYELVIKNYPTSSFASLAQQGLDKLKR